MNEDGDEEYLLDVEEDEDQEQDVDAMVENQLDEDVRLDQPQELVELLKP